MNSKVVLITLRLIHVVCGILWVGGAAVLVSFIIPAARRENGLVYLREIIWKRNLPRYLNVTLVLAILSGLTIYVNLTLVTYGAWARSRTGMLLGAGGALAILAAIIATFVAAPAVHRALELGASPPATDAGPVATNAEAVSASLHRYAVAMRGVLVLLLGTAALMAIARYA
jgi:uncharacterized membrane protein